MFVITQSELDTFPIASLICRDKLVSSQPWHAGLPYLGVQHMAWLSVTRQPCWELALFSSLSLSVSLFERTSRVWFLLLPSYQHRPSWLGYSLVLPIFVAFQLIPSTRARQTLTTTTTTSAVPPSSPLRQQSWELLESEIKLEKSELPTSRRQRNRNQSRKFFSSWPRFMSML